MSFQWVGSGDFKHDFRAVDQRGFRTECSCPRFGHVEGHAGPQNILVACRKCKHCRWVVGQSRAGQVEMELCAAEWAMFITLTIAAGPKRPVPMPEDDLHRVMDVGMFPKLMKRLRMNAKRRHGSMKGGDGSTSFTYLQCGEYGGKRGRVHFHALVFGTGPKPDWTTNPAYRLPPVRGQAQRYWIPEWPFGHVTVDPDPSGSAAFYISKYMRKDKGAHYSQSSARPIGAGWIAWKAAQLVKAGAMVPTLDFITEVRYPGKDFFRRSRFGHISRKALIRNANARDFILEFARLRGVTPLSLYRMATPTVRTVIVAAERWRRERLVASGAASGKVPLLARDAIKTDVWNEARAMLGLPLFDDAHARPVRHGDVGIPYADRRAAAISETRAARQRLSDLERSLDEKSWAKRRNDAFLRRRYQAGFQRFGWSPETDKRPRVRWSQDGNVSLASAVSDEPATALYRVDLVNPFGAS